ncbi:MAG: MFS transporter [Pseudomonadota bacterium]
MAEEVTPAKQHGLLLFAVVLLDMIGFGIVIPILPFITPTLGGDEFDIALIIASYAICAGIVGPFWGRLSDRFGRKPILICCTAGAAGGYLLLANADELWMIYAARVVAGLMAGNFPVASAMMADITPTHERAKGMGLIGAAFGLGLVMGPVLGGLLAGSEGSFMLPAMLAGGTSVLAAVAAGLFLPESRNPEVAQREPSGLSLWQVLRATQSRLLLLQYVFHTGSVAAMTYIFPLWVYALLDWQAKEVGIVFGVVGAVMALNQGLLMGRFVGFFGELPLLRVCVSLFFAGLCLTLVAHEPITMVGSNIIALTGATLCMPILNAMVSRKASVEERGRLMGAASTAASVGRVVGPLAAGALLTAGGFTAAWSLPLLFVFGYLLWAFSHWAKRPTPEMRAEH